MNRELSKVLKILIVFIFALSQGVAFATDAYGDYIDRFAPLAMEQQEEFGIPASITLAQGILESSAGRSTLAKEGNNHFGIKCHKEWQGETMLRDDDAPDECFRVYESPEESFHDHSLFLKRARYSSLFDLEPTDYASWARGLRACGYATDPNYADRLITIIEKYSLYSYDTPGGASQDVVEFIRACLVNSHVVRKSRGLHYVIATPGDTYASIAAELNMDADTLSAYNDAKADDEIKAWEEVYLQEKLETAPEGIKKATIGDGESMHSVAQRFGMKLSVLKELNPKAKDKAGTKLVLRK